MRKSFAVEVLLRRCLCSGSRQCEVRLELLSLHAACISDSHIRLLWLLHRERRSETGQLDQRPLQRVHLLQRILTAGLGFAAGGTFAVGPFVAAGRCLAAGPTLAASEAWSNSLAKVPCSRSDLLQRVHPLQRVLAAGAVFAAGPDNPKSWSQGYPCILHAFCFQCTGDFKSRTQVTSSFGQWSHHVR
mgnify:CR=1 FL=1